MKTLTPYASHDSNSKGRRISEPSPNNRTQYQRDRDRIIHSAAFRRLEYKTQVFVNHEGDMFRTRLTHSIEVAQIGRTIARALGVNEELTEAIALAHDLGHTPFGHAGQDILNQCMSNYGGFEHNLQSLRIVDKLEEKYAQFDGLNLTYETREGILKHCSTKKAQLLGDIGQRFIDKRQPSLEAQITNIADEIAYNSHDVDDGLRAGLLNLKEMADVKLFNEQLSIVDKEYPRLNDRRKTHEIIRRIINRQITDLLEQTQINLGILKPENKQAIIDHDQYSVSFSTDMRNLNLELKRFLRENLYRHYRVHRMTAKAGKILQALFECFLEDQRLLPPEAQAHVQALTQRHQMPGTARGIADYIAGMTDRFAIAEYERIFNPTRLT